jgi:hypothetical protein
VTYDDDELLAALADVLAGDEPFPAALATHVERAAFAMRRVDDELAELLFDTAGEAAAAVRGDGPRSLSFAAVGHELDVELEADGTIVGRVAPPDIPVSVEGPAGLMDLAADNLGRFTAPAPGSRLRFVLGTPPTRIVTPWIFR